MTRDESLKALGIDPDEDHDIDPPPPWRCWRRWDEDQQGPDAPPAHVNDWRKGDNLMPVWWHGGDCEGAP